MDTAGTKSILPPGTPLLAKTPRAAKLFDISERQLRYLRTSHKDLDALTVKVGRDRLWDVPKCYAWFGEYLGTSIETN